MVLQKTLHVSAKSVLFDLQQVMCPNHKNNFGQTIPSTPPSPCSLPPPLSPLPPIPQCGPICVYEPSRGTCFLFRLMPSMHSVRVMPRAIALYKWSEIDCGQNIYSKRLGITETREGFVNRHAFTDFVCDFFRYLAQY